ncbi:MAG: GIY-YIG nuclease family protein [Candidatus Hydrogenedentes bacterium]|nr:GIY-YIG nuclease family protein [Candidatus Hydrogenedentota bacterium]
MFWAYILRSETTGRHYCGSSDDVERRVRQHNDPAYHGWKTTKRFEGPWPLVWSEPDDPKHIEENNMEIFGYLGFVFGIFGLIGFSFATSAVKRIDKLESELSKLRELVEKRS